MKRDPKPPSLSAVVPSWAQESEIAPLRPLEGPLCDGSLQISTSTKTRVFRVDEAAAILKVSSKTVRRLLARGDLKAVRVGRLVRIHSSEIDRLFAGGCPIGGDLGGGGGHD